MSMFGRAADDWWQQHVWSPIGNWLSGHIPTSIWEGLSDKYLGTTNNSDRQRAEDMAFNAEQAQLNRNFQLDMWSRTNQYNSPQALMERFRAAGLNPSLMMSSGSPAGAVATPMPGSTAQHGGSVGLGSGDLALYHSQTQLAESQARLADAQARKVDEETRYQQYINAVEEQLQHVPVGEVHTVTDNGEDSYEVVYGNARVRITQSQMRAAGLSAQGLQYQLSDLMYDLAVKFGSDIIDPSVLPSSQPNYERASAALRGDLETQRVAGELAKIGEQAAQAEKAGRLAYAKWLEENKDKPLVQFALALQGFFQTFGISLPRIGGSSSSAFRGSRGTYSSSGSSWYFGN